ncbi:MAG: type-F conjugative transfer system secretin TraK, partial [Pseudomonadota bacterium]
PSRESGPYEDGLAEMLTRFAAGEIPAGYSTGSLTATHPRCRRVGGLQADFSGGQRFLGAAFDVFVGVVRNDGPTGASFDESWCADPSVAAVALWPAIQLAPGGLAEIFVVRRRAGASGAAAGSLPARPSLIGGR